MSTCDVSSLLLLPLLHLFLYLPLLHFQVSAEDSAPDSAISSAYYPTSPSQTEQPQAAVSIYAASSKSDNQSGVY